MCVLFVCSNFRSRIHIFTYLCLIFSSSPRGHKRPRSFLPTPRTLPLGVGRTGASGLDLFFNPLCSRVEAVEGTAAVLSTPLLAGVMWRGVASALLSGVDTGALTCSASDSFLARVDSERRPAVEGAGSAAAAVERRGLL